MLLTVSLSIRLRAYIASATNLKKNYSILHYDGSQTLCSTHYPYYNIQKKIKNTPKNQNGSTKID